MRGFIRFKKSENKTSHSIGIAWVETVRLKDGQVSQKHIAYFGTLRLDDLNWRITYKSKRKFERLIPEKLRSLKIAPESKTWIEIRGYVNYWLSDNGIATEIQF